MQFAKYHALGNDYLVVEAAAIAPYLTPAAIRRLCDRHLGIGSDGILVSASHTGTARFGLRIFNPDGGEAEKSGNGLRIFSRYLWDRGLVSEEPFEVATLGGVARCVVKGGGRSVSVEMGRARFDSASIPLIGAPREAVHESLLVGGHDLEFTGVNLGNPHCVFVRTRVSEGETRALGPLVEVHPSFPNRTNVEFVEVLDRANVRAEIWERGAGYTLASGSGGSAAAAVAHRLGLCDATVTVHMPGGALLVEMHDDFEVRITGPVVKVYEGTLSSEMLVGIDRDQVNGERSASGR